MTTNKKPRTAGRPFRGIKHKTLCNYYSSDALTNQEPSQEAHTKIQEWGESLRDRLKNYFIGNGGEYYVFE